MSFTVMFSFVSSVFSLFFFNATSTTEIYTLSLHDALPISSPAMTGRFSAICTGCCSASAEDWLTPVSISDKKDRKSTRLNSSHVRISYAVFCLKKKKKQTNNKHNSQKKNTTLNI